MRAQQFHQNASLISRLTGGPLVALLMIALFFAPMLNSTAQVQQDNRQLNREQTSLGQQRRIALVIGNGAYQTVKPLKNPLNDATLLAATLRKLGFEVAVGTDKSQREMKQLIREFGQRLRGGGGVGLFYFAGHGVQARGHNYLIPVDADIQTEADLEDVGVDVNYVLNTMDDAQNALNIAILDACRNNPFARSFRSAQEGLAQVKAPTGTLIAYATAPDSVAADGGGANSPYVEELTRQIQVPGVLLETMFRRVAEQVSSRSGGRQEPWYSANVKGDFFFSGKTDLRLSSSGPDTQPVRIDPLAVEREYWETIRSSSDIQAYEGYLKTYPTGAYASVARAKIRKLEMAQCTDQNMTIWYAAFLENRKSQLNVSYDAARKYLTACGHESTPVTNYIKKWVDSYEKGLKSANPGVGAVHDITDPGDQMDAANLRDSNIASNPNNRESSSISQRVTMKAFALDLHSCRMSGGDVICNLTVINKTESDKEFVLCNGDYRVKRRGKDSTKATDNTGNQYEPTEAVMGSNKARKGYLLKDVLAPQVPVRMLLTFHDVAAGSTSFTLLRIAAYEEGNGHPELIMYADFRNVVIEK
jgi:Caspase domain